MMCYKKNLWSKKIIHEFNSYIFLRTKSMYLN